MDIKFITPEEFKERVEDPVVLWGKEKILTQLMESTNPRWPKPDVQCIEDRFWTWIYYTIQKIGCGEYFEALESLSYFRMLVISPLMQIKNGYSPHGMRKLEFTLSAIDLENLKETVAEYDVQSIINSLDKIMEIYQELRNELYPDSIQLDEKLRQEAEKFLIETKQKYR